MTQSQSTLGRIEDKEQSGRLNKHLEKGEGYFDREQALENERIAISKNADRIDGAIVSDLHPNLVKFAELAITDTNELGRLFAEIINNGIDELANDVIEEQSCKN